MTTTIPTLRNAYDAGYRNGGRSADGGKLYWADGRPDATADTIREDGIQCMAVAMGQPWQESPVDRVMALPDLESLLAEFARGWADGVAGVAASAEQEAADPQWRGWDSNGNPRYRP
jgi:hypothetical protein